MIEEDTVLKELFAICEGESLSVQRLRPILKNFTDKLRDDREDVFTRLLHRAVDNENVTLDVVEYLVEFYPEAIKHQTDSGWLLLHRACLNPRPQLSIIQYLVHRYPEAQMIARSHFGLPIHCIFDRAVKEVPLDIVEFLCESSPKALRERKGDENGHTVLHLACRRKEVSVEIIRLLVQRYPDAVVLSGGYSGDLPMLTLFKECPYPHPDVVRCLLGQGNNALDPGDGDHSFPALHTACRHLDFKSNEEFGLEIIRLLVDADRNALETPARSFLGLPLHEACLNEKTTLDVVRYLVEQCSSSVRSLNAFHYSPLFYATSRELEILKFLVEQNPESVRTPHPESQRLLFHAASRQGPLENIKYLYSLYPDAISKTDQHGNLPLHLACAYQTSVEIFEYLLELDPDATSKTNAEGDLPLHIFYRQSDQPEYVALNLLKFFPSALFTKNANGCLLLHEACSSSATSLKTLHFLIDLYPDAIAEKDKQGRLPIHYAHQLSFNSRLESYTYLISLYPVSLRVYAPKHGLPIHVACRSNVDLAIIKYMAEQYPKSLDATCEKLVVLPLECAAEHAADEVFMYLFLQRYKSVMARNGGCPLHAIFRDRVISDKTPIARRFLELNPLHIKDRDRNGAAPLHVAVTTKLESNFIDDLIDLDPSVVEVADNQGWLPLHHAVRHGDPSQVKFKLGLLSNHHVSSLGLLGAPDVNGCLPLHVACRHGSTECAEVLVGMDPHAESWCIVDNLGEMPLHKACRGGHVDIVMFLAEKNKDSVLVANKAGMLPVMLLCQSSGKRDKVVFESAEFVEAIWLLIKMHPGTIRR